MLLEKITTLQDSLYGRLISPADEDYHTLRKVNNGMIDKYPALIAQCANVEDVRTCVNFARQNDLLLAIRAGGHNAAGLGVCDEGLVIDLSRMKAIHVDADAKTVLVEGGCLLQEMDEATHAFGMAVPVGVLSTTGVAGLTLGGGIGHLTRQYGLTIDNLLEAEVVLANGNMLKASATENADLFWAIRGGGGNFGVVVSFLFKMHPVHTPYAGPMLWEMTDAKEIMQWYRRYITEAPAEINGFFAFLTVPPAPPFPEHLHLKKMCGIVWCYTGNPDKAEEVFKPIRAVKTPAVDFCGLIPMPALQSMFDGLYPAGLQMYWKADFYNELSDEAIDLHLIHGAELPSLQSTMHLYPVNGAASKPGKDDTAWNFREAKWAKVILSADPDPANNTKNIQWARDYWTALHPHTAGGGYINFMMIEGEDAVKRTYADNYKKLAQVKAKYDPKNLFRVNQNIKPSK